MHSIDDIELISKSVLGSTLYGLNTPESDIDYGGVFFPTVKDILTNPTLKEMDLSSKVSKKGTRNTKDDEDFKIYTLQQFVHLIANNNPNIVEQLFIPEDKKIITSRVMEELRENTDKIISQRCLNTFTGYAYAQRKKLLTKRDRFTQLGSGLDYIRKVSTPYLMSVDTENLLAICKTYKSSKNTNKPFANGLEVAMLKEKLQWEYDNYGWRLHTESFDMIGYDVKFGMHLIRLLDEGRQLLETGSIQFPFSGKAYEDCMSIRSTKVSFDELMNMYDHYHDRCQQAFAHTTLPKTADVEWLNDFVYRNTVDYIKRSEL